MSASEYGVVQVRQEMEQGREDARPGTSRTRQTGTEFRCSRCSASYPADALCLGILELLSPDLVIQVADIAPVHRFYRLERHSVVPQVNMRE